MYRFIQLIGTDFLENIPRMLICEIKLFSTSALKVKKITNSPQVSILLFSAALLGGIIDVQKCAHVTYTIWWVCTYAYICETIATVKVDDTSISLICKEKVADVWIEFGFFSFQRLKPWIGIF